MSRMLHVSGTILDDQSPLVVGTLAENIRIAVMKSTIVDANIGAAASIRIVNPNHMKKEDFIWAKCLLLRCRRGIINISNFIDCGILPD